MDKAARLGAIKTALEELDRKSIETHELMNKAIINKLWVAVKDAANVLMNIELVREDLMIETKSLQEAIEEEIKEVL